MATPTAVPVNPAEAIAYFKARGFQLEPTFSWQDAWQEEHTGMFTVAKSAGFDVLQDIRDALDEAISNGTTLDQFREQLTPILQEKGWWGKKDVIDPASGEPVTAQLGSPRRLRTIFNVNLRTSYMAGKWQRIARVAGARPFLRYITMNDNRVRPQHRLWNNIVLRFDDPWWNTHFPPNGWNCRCDVQQLSDRDVNRLGLKVLDKGPPVITRPFENWRTGAVEDVPIGIDPGWGYNVGKASVVQHTGKDLMDKLAGMDPDLAAAAGAASRAFALTGVSLEYLDWAKGILGGARIIGSSRVVGTLSTQVLDAIDAEPQSAAITISDDGLWHMVRKKKRDDQILIPETDVLRLPQILAFPRAVLMDKRDGRLLYVFDPSESDREGKIIIEVGFTRKQPPGSDGIRRKVTTNQVITGSLVEMKQLQNEGAYDLISGSLE